MLLFLELMRLCECVMSSKFCMSVNVNCRILVNVLLFFRLLVFNFLSVLEINNINLGNI